MGHLEGDRRNFSLTWAPSILIIEMYFLLTYWNGLGRDGLRNGHLFEGVNLGEKGGRWDAQLRLSMPEMQ